MFKFLWKTKHTKAQDTDAAIFPFGLKTLVEPVMAEHTSNPSISIVFVHGLAGSVDGTWTHAETKSFWPVWLPEIEELQGVRILSFGYNAAWNTVWKPNNTLDISDFAKQLAHELWMHYSESGDSKTVFVAHSMGGLVLKKALIIAHNTPRYAKLLENTVAVAFLGTPHRGADLASLLKISFSQTKFVQDLSPFSQAIKEINDAFGERIEGLKMASFWESTGLPGLGIVVPEISATLGLPGELRVPLNGNHLEIVKYSSREDNNYRVVSRTLIGLLK